MEDMFINQDTLAHLLGKLTPANQHYRKPFELPKNISAY